MKRKTGKNLDLYGIGKGRYWKGWRKGKTTKGIQEKDSTGTEDNRKDNITYRI